MRSAANQRLSVESELSNLATALLETFSALETDASQQLDTTGLLKNYIRSVTRCGLAAGRSGALQLQDHCVHFQGILKSLQTQPAEVVAQYQHVLEQWPLLLMSQISSGQDEAFTQQLETLLASTRWPHDTAIHDDATGLAPAQNVPSSETPAEPPGLAQADVNQPELLMELETALQGVVSLAASTAPMLCLQAINDCADRLELFAVSAAASGLFGLMDIAQLFQAGLREQANRLSTDPSGWHCIRKLHKAMADYLAAPAGSSEPLLAALQAFLTTQPLDMSELAQLSALLNDADPGASDDCPDLELDASQVASETPVVDNALADSTAAPELGAAARELLQLISSEFEPLSAELAAHLQDLLDHTLAVEQRQAALDQYTLALQRFVEVFDSIGLVGLRQLFSLVLEFVQTLLAQAQDNIEQQFWLAEWPAHVLNYLADPYAHVETLIQHCQASGSPLVTDKRDELCTALRHPQLDSGEEDVAPRATVAEPEAVSLQLPEDVNPQLLESLLQELPQQTAEFSRVIARIVQGHGSLQDIETAQRLAHTLKGSANTVGVAGIANLTHHIEDILLAFTREKAVPTAPLTTTLQDAADVLEMMSEALVGMAAPPQQQALAVLQQILDWANQIDLNGLPTQQDPATVASSPPGEPPVTATTPAATDNSLRIATSSVDETLRLLGEATIVNAQLHESLRRSLAHNKAIQTQSLQFQQLAFELEQLIDVRGMHGLLSGVNHSDFDALELDQYNELHTLTRRMVEAATDTRTLTQYAEDELKQLDGLLHQQKRHTKDTQDVVMKTRMLPVQTIVPRLQRSVRQTCRLTGKQADLIINGSETLLDNDILTLLADPLMHILRNAVDHGIESPALREQAGKAQTGRITLSFTREGEHILIRCQDDGAGLDYDAIKRVALERGVVQQDEILSTDSLTRLIFVSGLSTRDETTQMSGRGIGMDAVYTQVSRMKGMIRVSSEPQAGVLVEIQLPATLVTLHGILAQVGNQVLAIANRGVEQILYAEDGTLDEKPDHTLTYQYKDAPYPAYFLEDLLGMARPPYILDAIRRPTMLLTTPEGDTVAILIERILTTQDVVIKKLGPYAPALIGVEGVTILGDGSVAAVMDLGIAVSASAGTRVVPRIESSDNDGIQSGAPKVLVVDDSLSARNSLAEFMQDSGYRVCTARDGMEAITQLDAEAPDILLVDMEMPRMNGLELAAYVRANAATQKLPIIMITSRATDKHRAEAHKAGVNAYLTKPYSESEVLDQITTQLKTAFTTMTA